MKTLYLYGNLGKRFGKKYVLDVRDPAEAVRALGTQLAGFSDEIKSGNWHVISGPLEKGSTLDEDGLKVALGSQREIHIMPAIEGAGGSWGNIIIGAAMIAAAFYTGGASMAAWTTGQASLAAAGAGMALGGVAQMLAPSPTSNYDDRESPNQRPSFLFDGPVNTSTQGLPVPVVYGRIKTGSVVVSAGMTAEELNE
ncbi:hypothetical protein ACM25P_13030 [Vreelandella alkaliphila]|uniref:hypothetical protein n=1 Tax=Vreelandella alkaliphila TaxID=272774 RepID=UPI0039F4F03D